MDGKDVGGRPDSRSDLYGGSDQHYTLSVSSEALGKYDESLDFPSCGRNRHSCHSPASSAQILISEKYILDRKKSDDAARIIANAAPSPLNINWPELQATAFLLLQRRHPALRLQ